MQTRRKAESSTRQIFLWAVIISILLLAAPQLTSGQSKFATPNPVASVALVAQIPESVSVTGRIQPAPAIAEENGVRASILVLQSTWHMAMGRSVSATAHLEATSEEAASAALIPLRQVGEPVDARDIPVFSFLARQTPTRVDLVHNLNPRLGRQSQINGILILHPDAPAAQPQTVFITVTAL